MIAYRVTFIGQATGMTVTIKVSARGRADAAQLAFDKLNARLPGQFSPDDARITRRETSRSLSTTQRGLHV